ncbi:hypothetical protein L6164_006722 [Bauhinia variegata]|uniref:Uncharacterized protein n=1 Tax=Bauhinia variegata TaxID=167791 RepID=A0ACB9PXD6_BAUVA|nr:hypothetical protein L6164_006722 [Bauhinia variegata]
MNFMAVLEKLLDEHLKVGLGFDLDEKGMVSSWEIKKKVEQLLIDEIIRTKSHMKLKEMLMSNIAEGGRSLENFNKFVKWLKDLIVELTTKNTVSEMSNLPIVLVLPVPAQGHVNSFMSFSRKLVEHGFKVIFVNSDFIHKRVMDSWAESKDSFVGSNIEFVSISDGLRPEDDRTDTVKVISGLTNAMPAQLEKLIEDVICVNGKISCIVADVHMGWALEIASKLGIKRAALFTYAAAMLALLDSIPRMIDYGIIDSNGTPIQKRTFQLSPNMPVMHTDQIWWSNNGDLDSQKETFHYNKGFLQILNSTEWWLCNTTYELERGPLSFLPKLLPIGPFMENSQSTRSLGQFWEEDLDCLNWLDQQPPCSVIYVAFGSFTLFDAHQFKELALGLRLTNRPFLWIVRSDVNINTKYEYPNEFKGNVGKIVGWAPQKQVLSHPAIACFISHCGWNSTIEGLWNGVPFLCWPYFCDQFFNKQYICDEWKLGLGFDLDASGIVSSGEIKKKVDQLLDDESIRTRSMKLKETLMSNMAEDSPTSENFNKFVKWVKE